LEVVPELEVVTVDKVLAEVGLLRLVSEQKGVLAAERAAVVRGHIACGVRTVGADSVSMTKHVAPRLVIAVVVVVHPDGAIVLGVQHVALTWVIKGHQRSSKVIIGHQRSSEVIRGHQRSSEVISG
jgi:hypothetical protein